MATPEGILTLNGALLKKGRIGIEILPDIDSCMKHMASLMISEIEKNNSITHPTLLIVPVGPVMHYPYFVRAVNEKHLSLTLVSFINMDEYMKNDKQYIDLDHVLSFRRFMNENVFSQINPDLVMSPSQRIFPAIDNAEYIDQVIESHGGVDLCLGGIGINGHVAFNEPPEADEKITESEYLKLSVRLQKVARETKVVNSINDLHGAYDNIPDYCVTLGFKQILASRVIRLFCFRDWQKSVVRKAAFGEMTMNFPVSLLQTHKDCQIIIPQDLA